MLRPLRSALLLGAWLVTCVTASAQPTARLILDHWRVEDGLPQNTVTGITQDGSGYLWVATRKGLARFDGAHFKPIHSAGDLDLRNVRLTSVLPEPDGSVWVGTYGEGVVRVLGGVATRYGEAEGVPHDVVWDVTRDREGRVWLASSGGARYFDGQRWQAPALPPDVASDGVNVVYQDRDRRIWLATWTHGLVRLDGTSVRRFSVADGMPASSASSMAEAPDGTIWAATPMGLASIKDDIVTAFGRAQGLPVDRMLQVIVDRRGVVWAATHGGGLLRHDVTGFRAFGRQDGLSSEYLISLHEDRDGALWIGTLSGGLNRLAPTARELLDARSGLPPYPITTIYQTRTGTFWVGTYGGGLARIHNGIVRAYTTADGLPSNAITSVAGGDGDSVWVATNGAGAFRWLDGRVVERVSPAIVGSSLRTIEVDHAVGGALWFGGDGLIRYEDGRWQRFGEAEGLRSREVRVIYTVDERVWVGTYGGGLQSIERDGRIVTWGDAEGLTNRFVTSLHMDAGGTLWIGTYGGGLFRLRDGRIDGVSTSDGLADDVVFDILEDGVGRLWLTGTQGLAVVRMADVDGRIAGRQSPLSVSTFGRADGVPGTDGTDGNQPLSWRALDGRLWFGTVGGVVIFDPLEAGDTPPPPRVFVDGVRADKKWTPHAPGGGPIRARNLDIEFSAPLLHGGRAVQYEYRLVGLDDRWVEAGTGRTASFTNLAPGDYRFEVRARARRGAEAGTVRSLSIVAPARIHETLWFRGAALALGVLAVLGLGRVRMTRLQARQQELEALVADRTAALRHEMQERERAQQERRLLDERVQQAQRLESLGLLAGGVAHDFNNLLVGVLGEASLALADMPDGTPPRRHVERIERAALRASELTAQMLAYSGGGRFVVVPLDLGTLVRDVLDVLDPAIPRDIAVTLDVPGDLPPVGGDPSQMQQVLRNLLTNAVDAIGDRPGRITIAAGTRVVRADDSVAIVQPDQPAMAPGPHVWLSVHDDGIGMDSDTQARIFEPFFSTKTPGRGLGLAAVQGIVRSHGGRIAVSSRPRRGTAVTLLLPAFEPVLRDRPAPPPEAPASPPIAPPSAPPVPTQEREVLVVDDERLVRDVASAALRRAGHKVSEVPTGEDAVAAFEARPDDFAIIVLDLTLPGIQGRAVMTAVRTIRPGVPIVLTSGYTVEEAGDMTMAPRTSFLQKPWRPEQLVARVEALLPQAGHGDPRATIDRLT